MINQTIKSTALALTAASILASSLMWSTPAAASEPFIAEIKMFGSNFAPRGYALCDGQLLPISQNTALFSLLGTTYGGDGRTTFGLPDLRGRVAIHPGNGPGLSSISLGQKGGQEARTLSVNQMPSHTHTMTAVLKGIDVSGDSTMPSSHSLASKSRSNNYSSSAPNVDMHADSLAVSAANTGGNQSFSIRDPYLAVNYIIALTGTFPSRN